ncbi:putative acyl-CoA synthetase [Actinoplanes missouriensis 431]|uniref:Putative acyl-CoA synthetase n=1 Tax=Actinoplanes missouriensis (strain ATCC 14538 / DSM 43046 / CBS 188.64 / JCM 3121 / NBRC 102363 / NCIMB 12654 / NRRL B-3342 / UNCC 431) TaxID=512565 RepID=I0H4J6_ACTM4|nr:acetate--CoA ligase [Actinoplanes missouriensis]BAL87933.1 putative acyl-CoA synthetase [Actinoplanes missouriensis 431]
MIEHQVAGLFNPRAIALIGATDKSLWSASTYANLMSYGFTGPVHLVNPKGGTVHGTQAYPTIGDLPDGVDLAFVMVPTHAVLGVLEQAADKGITSAIVLTAGFAEVGAEGARLEAEIVALARRRRMVILGPNGNGFINAARSITPYGIGIVPPLLRGPVGIVLQSGALASYVLGFARARNIGISLMVSMGNEAMIGLTDAVRYLVRDPDTKVLALFIESIRDPAEFVAIAREALAAGKPIVALKVGRSQKSESIAKAHTGSLVGDDNVVDAVFRQCGVIRVDALEDLVMTAGLLARTGPLPGKRIAFVTASGGTCEIAADRADDERLEIPDFAPATVERLTRILPSFATVQNPLDVTGYVLVNTNLLSEALTIVDADPGVDIIVLATDLPREQPADEATATSDIDLARGTAEAIAACTKPVVVMGTTLTDITAWGRHVAEAVDFPGVLGGIHHTATVLGRAVAWSDHWRKARNVPAGPAELPPPLEVDAVPGSTWTEHRAATFLAAHGVPMVDQQLASSAEEAVAAAERIGYPVVVKLAADVAHKSDIGGVALGLAGPDAVAQAFAAVTHAGERAGATVHGAVVQPMRDSGVELLVGVIRDPAWGLVLAVGLGGLWVEVLQDTALRLLPVDHQEVLAALRELRGAKLFDGARGTEKVDLDAVAATVVAIATVAHRLGDRLESLEINPLLVHGARTEALDALINWR